MSIQFKILKGDSSNLPSVKPSEGTVYFTEDDGKIYIDIKDSDVPVVGNTGDETIDGAAVNRVCINQKLYTYSDYDVLDCNLADGEDTIVFDCN